MSTLLHLPEARGNLILAGDRVGLTRGEGSAQMTMDFLPHIAFKVTDGSYAGIRADCFVRVPDASAASLTAEAQGWQSTVLSRRASISTAARSSAVQHFRNEHLASWKEGEKDIVQSWLAAEVLAGTTRQPGSDTAGTATFFLGDRGISHRGVEFRLTCTISPDGPDGETFKLGRMVGSEMLGGSRTMSDPQTVAACQEFDRVFGDLDITWTDRTAHYPTEADDSRSASVPPGGDARRLAMIEYLEEMDVKLRRAWDRHVLPIASQ